MCEHLSQDQALSKRLIMRWKPSRRRFTRRALMLLKLVLLLMLAGGSAAEASSRSARRQAEEEQQLMEGDDSACLKGFLDTMRQEESSSSSVSIVGAWTATAIASPCKNMSTLTGITCNNSRVASIVLPSANLAGTLPSSLSSCYFLHTLDLSSNSLTGVLPPALGALSLLATLALANNQLTGPIPYELATCSSLASLDLHRNEITGSIPGQLGLLPLRYFDVSDNKLSGRIPSTLSNTSSGSPRFNASSFANNPNLYGFPLNLNPPSSSSLPSNSPPPHGRGLSFFGILGIALASGLASFTVFFFAFTLWLDIRDKRTALLEEAEAKGSKRESSSRSEEYIGWKEILDRL